MENGPLFEKMLRKAIFYRVQREIWEDFCSPSFWWSILKTYGLVAVFFFFVGFVGGFDTACRLVVAEIQRQFTCEPIQAIENE